jgi:hypothetical protein
MGSVGRCFVVRERAMGGLCIIPLQLRQFNRNPKSEKANRSAGPHDHSRTALITKLVEIRGDVFCTGEATALPPDVPPDDAVPNNNTNGVLLLRAAAVAW